MSALVECTDALEVVTSKVVIDDDARRTFTTGQCHALAIALARRLRTRPAVVLDWDLAGDATGETVDPPPGAVAYSAEDDDTVLETWVHAVVPYRGRLLDVTGGHTYDEVRRAWGGRRWRHLGIHWSSATQLRAISRDRRGENDEYGEYAGPWPDVARATPYVDAVLAAYRT